MSVFTAKHKVQMLKKRVFLELEAPLETKQLSDLHVGQGGSRAVDRELS